MDTSDQYEPQLPAQFSDNSLRLPASFSANDLAIPAETQFDPRVILRGLIRHWWQIVLIWLALSIPAAYLIFLFIQPTYTAFSVLRVEPAAPDLFAPIRDQAGEMNRATPYLETQVQLIKSNTVLEAAVANQSVSQYPMIKNSYDPITDLRLLMVVGIVPDAYLIRVALESTNPQEAAAIVNAVVESYRVNNESYTQDANKRLRKSLADEEKRLQVLISQTQDNLKDLMDKGNVAIDPKERIAKPGATEDPDQPAFANVAEELYRQTVGEMMRTESELMVAESKLNVMQEAMSQDGSVKGTAEDDSQALIEEEFKKDPAVIALITQISETRDHLEHVRGLARQKSDTAHVAARRQLDKLEADYRNLWETKYNELSSRIKAGGDKTQDPKQLLNELRMNVAQLKQLKDRQQKKFEQMGITTKAANNDTFTASMLDYSLKSLLSRQDQVARNIAQLDFRTNQEPFRVVLIDKASTPKIPSNNKRLKLMAVVPFALLMMIVGLFLLVEIRAQRVADPDALSSRVRSRVYALPPLPTARAIRKLSAPAADDQIEQFIQRLDHIRFAVCSSSGDVGRGRCVLITSAIGGEGKTTLAAQLAARCGNAGMSTLLIDADLRRSALCTLLDIPEGLGLSDVLKGDSAVEEVVIPVQGGTFVLLPAGTPIQDTSRVLHSRKFEALISQLRQVYDLIIIDSPPVLPVPDALIMGRCADGAVLASRYDISRFPQVERARRQLDSAGIAVLGTVINGMRRSDSYYGTYTYGRRHASAAESSNTI
jgi:capsular exopolysaccharide synthesis family protein